MKIEAPQNAKPCLNILVEFGTLLLVKVSEWVFVEWVILSVLSTYLSSAPCLWEVPSGARLPYEKAQWTLIRLLQKIAKKFFRYPRRLQVRRKTNVLTQVALYLSQVSLRPLHRSVILEESTKALPYGLWSISWPRPSPHSLRLVWISRTRRSSM